MADQRDRGFTFTCTGCGFEIHTAVWDGIPTCLTCRWFDERPQIPREVRDRVLGIFKDNGCGNG